MAFRIQNPLYISIPAICDKDVVTREVWMAKTSKAFLNGMGIAELFPQNNSEGSLTFVGHMAESYKQDFADTYSTMGVEVRMVKIAIEGVVMYYESNKSFLLKSNCMSAIDTMSGMAVIVE